MTPSENIVKVFGAEIIDLPEAELNALDGRLKKPTCCLGASAACQPKTLNSSSARLLSKGRVACELHARIITTLEPKTAFVHGSALLTEISRAQSIRAKARAEDERIEKELRESIRVYIAQSEEVTTDLVDDKDVDEALDKVSPSDLKRMKELIRGLEPVTKHTPTGKSGDKFASGNMKMKMVRSR
jgi:hypothetical protein